MQGQTMPQLFSCDFIREALIISDLFELNEYAAVELLLGGRFIALASCHLILDNQFSLLKTVFWWKILL